MAAHTDSGPTPARHRRQNRALVVAATLAAFWLGTAAPGVSPVAGTVPPAPSTPAIRTTTAATSGSAGGPVDLPSAAA
jgi:hypothetical protein